jgi:hypothetical protein
MTTRVTFALRAWSGEDERLLSEEQLTTSGPALQAATAGKDDYGYVTLRSDGMSDFVAADELETLVGALCFGTIAELASGKPAEVRYYTYFGGFELLPEGGQIRLMQEGVEQARYPAAELLPALVDCGERYVDYLQRLHGDKEGMQAYYAELRGEAEAARAAIAG